jgi:hypothetical protein
MLVITKRYRVMAEECRMAPTMRQRRVQASQAEHESQSIFHLVKSAGRQHGDALCEQRLVNSNKLGNINDRIPW